MKWLPIAIVVVLAAGFVVMQRNATKSAYVNGIEPYNTLPGREYIVERDCYVFSDSSRKTDFPLIADAALVPALPAKVESNQVGKTIGTIKLLDVARVGDRIHIVSVRRETTPKSETISFELLFDNPDAHKYPRIDAFLVLDHSPETRGEPPKLLERYLVDRDRN